ncbi:MAG TPA: HAD family phosphatase [Gemmataceae bacterium]|nr:HAD family phosphatase [Gemmataceae bacterium]
MKALVFDFGNVICFFDHHRATDRLAEYADLSSEAMVAQLFGGSLEEDYESGWLSTAEYLRHVRKLCGLRCPDDVLTAAYGDIFWPNQEVCDLLPLLKPRYRLLLGSNTTELHARQFCRQFADVLRHFDALVLSYQIGARKPQPAFFEHCLRLAGCAAQDCLFIDDLPANVAGAVACGWHGIVYTGIADLRRRFAALGIL